MAAEDKLKLAQFIDGEDEGHTPWNVADQIRETVKDQRKDRKVDCEKNWNYYQGDHSQYFKQRKDEPDEVYGLRKTDAVIANYCKFIIDLSAKYAYGRPEKVRREFTKENSPVPNTEDRMRKIEELIDIQQFMLKAKRWAGIFGEQPVRLIPLDERSGEQVFGKSTQTTFPHPTLLDPRYTFPLKNSWGKLIAIVIEDSFRDYARGTEVKTLELIVEDSRWYWEDDGLVSAEVNTYSLAEEFVVFDNCDTRKDEIEPIQNLQNKLNEALTDAAHFFQKHGWPQMVTDVDLSNVMYSPNYVWQIESDDGQKVMDKVGFLTWDGRMKEAGEYRRELETLIFKIAAVAPMATGDPESIGQLRTGAALVAAHGPSIQGATEKQVAWEANEKLLFQAIAKFDSKLHRQSVETRFKGLRISIKFPSDFVPGEELVRAEIDTMSLNSHTTTIKEVLRKNYPNATEAEIDELRKEVIKDSEELTDSKRAFLTEQKEGKPVDSANKKSVEQKKT